MEAAINVCKMRAVPQLNIIVPQLNFRAEIQSLSKGPFHSPPATRSVLLALRQYFMIEMS